MGRSSLQRCVRDRRRRSTVAIGGVVPTPSCSTCQLAKITEALSARRNNRIDIANLTDSSSPALQFVYLFCYFVFDSKTLFSPHCRRDVVVAQCTTHLSSCLYDRKIQPKTQRTVLEHLPRLSPFVISYLPMHRCVPGDHIGGCIALIPAVGGRVVG